MLPEDVSIVTDEARLRALHLKPMSRAADKVLRRLDKHCRDIIALSPFCVISTFGPGGADVSPRGDPPGFVRVLDDTQLLLPDRIGNNRLDSMANLLGNPAIGMLFLVPGMNETLRINGRARITDDPRLLGASAMQGRAPTVGLMIGVEEAFVHCAKALVRSDLWNGAKHIDRGRLASYGQMLTDHCEGLTAEESERQGRIMAERGLY
jgi:PPOX class probable FMN-dependent enzyme